MSNDLGQDSLKGASRAPKSSIGFVCGLHLGGRNGSIPVHLQRYSKGSRISTIVNGGGVRVSGPRSIQEP